MLRTKNVVYCTVDPFLSSRGKFLHGFEGFQQELDQLEIPCVWLTSRSRLQIDDPRRKLSHTEPFIAEDGCGVFLPEDYFHLKSAKTVRLGRFTCIPMAKLLPAAREALEALAEESGVAVVPLHSLTPRELSQNIGLPTREAEIARQRDFDELFFFAGASDEDISRFRALAKQNNFSLRQHEILWSLSAGEDLARCIREVGDLYDRSFRSHANRFAIATSEQSASIFPSCDRGVRLVANTVEGAEAPGKQARFTDCALTSTTLWDTVLSLLTARG